MYIGEICRVFSGQLLVDSDWYVINGDWVLEKKGDVFLHPLTKKPIDIRLLGYIDYDGDYNKTLIRFENGEGTHISDLAARLSKNQINNITEKEIPMVEFCKKQYYGIDCSCTKCER